MWTHWSSRTAWEHSYVRPHVFVYHTCAWTCTRGQIHDFDIQDSARLQIKTTLDCSMFAFLRESDEAVLRVQSMSTASVQKENHAHLSEGSNSTVGSLQTSFTLFEVLWNSPKRRICHFLEKRSLTSLFLQSLLWKQGGKVCNPAFIFIKLDTQQSESRPHFNERSLSQHSEPESKVSRAAFSLLRASFLVKHI